MTTIMTEVVAEAEVDVTVDIVNGNATTVVVTSASTRQSKTP